MWKDKGLQLVMLPTENKVNALRGYADRSLLFRYQESYQILESESNLTCYYNLYLLSDEEIKEGDWFTGKDLDGCNHILKCGSIKDAYYYTDNKEKGGYSIVKKIITCLDPSLNLPQFPSSFLEEYIKRYNSKKSLEVEVDCNEVVWQQSSDRYNDNDVYCNGEKVASFDYELQEEEMDRFTDRLGKQPKVNPDNTISIRFKEEKMYSRSEIEKLCRRASYIGHDIAWCDELHKELVDNWIKENLK